MHSIATSHTVVLPLITFQTASIPSDLNISIGISTCPPYSLNFINLSKNSRSDHTLYSSTQFSMSSTPDNNDDLAYAIDYEENRTTCAAKIKPLVSTEITWRDGKRVMLLEICFRMRKSKLSQSVFDRS